MNFSISSDGRRHQERASHAKLAKSKGSTKGGMVHYVAHGQNEVDVSRAETMFAYWISHQNLPMSAANKDVYAWIDDDGPSPPKQVRRLVTRPTDDEERSRGCVRMDR